MEKRTIFLYVLDTLADWEPGYAISELNSKRYFKKDAPAYFIKTLAANKHSITTMGGIKIIPDAVVGEFEIDETEMLILPGSEEWENVKHATVLDLAENLLNKGKTVAAICGGTSALADRGLLDNFKHTSNDLGYLQHTCKHYNGSENYQAVPAVTDRNLITASSVGALEFAREIFKKLGVFSTPTLEAWYQLFNTKKPQYFTELMDSVNQ
ncbi:MAG: type 1 glutamine amidotransferase family protein [Chryseolinea sp.]